MKIKVFYEIVAGHLEKAVNDWVEKGEWEKIYWETMRLTAKIDKSNNAYGSAFALVVMYDPKHEGSF